MSAVRTSKDRLSTSPAGLSMASDFLVYASAKSPDRTWVTSARAFESSGESSPFWVKPCHLQNDPSVAGMYSPGLLVSGMYALQWSLLASETLVPLPSA